MLQKRNADPVLWRFQVQFILVTTLFVVVLLAGTFIVAIFATYSQHEHDINEALQIRSVRIEQVRGSNTLEPKDTTLEPKDTTLGRKDTTLGPKDTPLDSKDMREFDGTPDRGPGEQRDAARDPLVVTSAYFLDSETNIEEVVSDELALDDEVVQETVSYIFNTATLNEGDDLRGKVDQLNLYYKISALDDGYLLVVASGNYIDRAIYSLFTTVGSTTILMLLCLLALIVVLSHWVVKPVERAWNQQRQFIADASHELKTPLSVIRANDSLIMADPTATVASQMQWIESTETEATIMQDLVNDMLFLAKSENTQNEVVKSVVDFSTVVQGAELQFESVAFERGVLIESSIADGIQVMGEEKSLARLVGTLLDNACKYAQDGGRVNLGLTRGTANCTLKVTNTGEPIPAEDLPHVFDRFYRSDKARTREQGGFGLGLAIAKSIVEEHKGNIEVSSSQGEGTTFTVVLPVI